MENLDPKDLQDPQEARVSEGYLVREAHLDLAFPVQLVLQANQARQENPAHKVHKDPLVQLAHLVREGCQVSEV